MAKLLITPDLTLYQALSRVAAEYPDRPALVFEGVELTYRELHAKVDQFARELCKLGVGPGDKVALLMPNCREFVYAFFAPSALGAAIVPLNPVYRQKEIQHILADSEASVVIADPCPRGNDLKKIIEELRPSLPHLKHAILRGEAAPGFLSLADLSGDGATLTPSDISPSSVCALVYTSGTTGVPKAVMHSHRSMISAVSQSESRLNEPLLLRLWHIAKLVFQYDSRFLKWGLKQYTYMGASPLHALLGYSALIYGLLYGYRVVITDRFNPAHVFELIEQAHVNAMTLSPTMVAALLKSSELGKRDLSSLLYVLMAAAPCPPDLVRQARKAFGCPVVIAFGTTEVGGATLITNPFDAEPLQAETVGKLLPGMEGKIVDDQRHELPRGQSGELALRLGSNMLGYYKAAETTAQATDTDGWYYTGDLATMDDKGYIRIVGRKKDMIIRGGQNIFPAEIENHLLSRPDILNAAVVGVPDALLGEQVWAFVVPREGVKLAPADVWNSCRKELAAYKVPDQVRIVDSLPMTSTGKPQKFVLREKALQERA